MVDPLENVVSLHKVEPLEDVERDESMLGPAPHAMAYSAALAEPASSPVEDDSTALAEPATSSTAAYSAALATRTPTRASAPGPRAPKAWASAAAAPLR